MNNLILNHITKCRKGHYVHALECSSVYDLQVAIENLINELKDQFTANDFVQFFSSMELYYIPVGELTVEQNESMESELYSFDSESFIKNYCQ